MSYLTTDATWQLIEVELNAQLALARSRLESPTLGIDDTNVVRGRIATLKELLALPTKLDAQGKEC